MQDSKSLKAYSLSLAMGTISAVLYCTALLSPLFLLPIQVSGGKKGLKSMGISSVVSAVIIIIWQMVLLFYGNSLNTANIIIALNIPLVMLLALFVVALPQLKKIQFGIRILIVGFVSSLLMIPTMIEVFANDNFAQLIKDMVLKTVPMIENGAASFDQLWEVIKASIMSMYMAIIVSFLFVSTFIGSSIARRSKRRIIENIEQGKIVVEVSSFKENSTIAPKISDYKLPTNLVWLLLSSWALLLINRLLQNQIVSVVAFNVALSLSICYSIQGLAIFIVRTGRNSVAPALRLILPIAVLLSLLNETIGVIVFVILILVGTLETWIPLRTVTKGEQP